MRTMDDTVKCACPCSDARDCIRARDPQHYSRFDEDDDYSVSCVEERCECCCHDRYEDDEEDY